MELESFNDFLNGDDTLHIYRSDSLIFTSLRRGILPLLEYAGRFTPHETEVAVYDRVVGNAAALLLRIINCREIFTPVISEPALETLRGFGIACHYTKVVPRIQSRAQDGLCPMETLSLGKDPESFYRACLDLDLGG